MALSALRLAKYEQSVAQWQSITQTLDRQWNSIKSDYQLDPQETDSEAWRCLSESLSCLGRFAEARDAAQRALAAPSMQDRARQVVSRRLEFCKQLVAVESRLPAILAGKKLPADAATRRALAEWLYRDKHSPFKSATVYEAAFGEQPSLADDLLSQNRLDAACAACQASCGHGDDAAALDDATKARLRKQALAWLKAEHAGWEKVYADGAAMNRFRAAEFARSCEQNGDLAGLRDPAALAKLPLAESKEWQTLWAEFKALAARDPLLLLNEARSYVSEKQWVKAAQSYQRYIDGSRTDTGNVWFECAAAQLLAGDRPAYRKTCEQMLKRATSRANMRTYLAARACTLADHSVADAELPARQAASELAVSGTEFWSLTEQGDLSFRAGSYAEAIALFQRSLRADGRPGVAVLNWLWLSLTYQKLGETVEARQWLKKADDWLDSLGAELPPDAETALGLHRHNWLEANVLRKEAEAAIGSSRGQ